MKKSERRTPRTALTNETYLRIWIERSTYGAWTIHCQYMCGAKQIQSTIHVIRGNHGSLLSYRTACNLGFVDIKVNQIQSHETSDVLDRVYSKALESSGSPSHWWISQQATRRTPFHLRKQVSKELDNLEQQGIIEKVDGATPWVSPIVVIPKKKGGVRLCIDMRMPNQAIRRERHPTLTVDDLIHTLNGAIVFSKLDLKAGYHQIPLAPESRHITTFVTHKGLLITPVNKLSRRDFPKHYQWATSWYTRCV